MEELRQQGSLVKAASRQLAQASGALRSEVLEVSAQMLLKRSQEVLSANGADIAEANVNESTPAALDRLTLTPARIQAMAEGLLAVAKLPDPVGEVVGGSIRPNGLAVSQVRVPLGVVGIIYENRPNVTTDAAGLCLRSGNAAYLRGSASAQRTNLVLVDILQNALEELGLPRHGVAIVADTSHEAAAAFMKLNGIIDCLIPRGGPSLIASMREHASVPYVIDGDGNCHIYVDASANLDMAEAIVVNAKTQRPGVCNAVETVLVHQAVATTFLPQIEKALKNVILVGDARALSHLSGATLATEEDFATEFLSLKLAIGVVRDVNAAIEHITRYSSGHSEAIITENLASAQQFVAKVDAAAVLVNASTRFIDGSELGLGAEIGISTQKLHARGPMGLEALTSQKWVVYGNGQVRG